MENIEIGKEYILEETMKKKVDSEYSNKDEYDED